MRQIFQLLEAAARALELAIMKVVANYEREKQRDNIPAKLTIKL